MRKLIAYRRLTNWIAAIAILFAALSGGMSQVFAKTDGDSQLTAICTSTGMKYVKISNLTSGKQSQDSSKDSADCPYCSFNQNVAGLVGEQLRFNFQTDNESIRPKSLRIVINDIAGRLPPSRAPPVLFC